MKYLDFYEIFRDFPILSTREIKNNYPDFQQIQLSRWQKSGLIKKISKGYYSFQNRDQFGNNEDILFYTANRIYHPSYISLESAFSFYNLIPEGVYLITSVGTKKTLALSTDDVQYSYKHILPRLFFGYELIQKRDFTFKIATLEKSLLDYFYLNPHIDSNSDFEGLRINTDELNRQLNHDRLKTYLKTFNKKSLDRRIQLFLDYLKYA